ncbi:M56 family metallopeptidase [Roseivirga sp. E12]|uniref:M56 family metallopeptidase n=1 Tax=Roseivirga sp. E12 TaxID=2819237 RepID=UPI001ABCD0E0|nr:M56 family metallopeptidase [Roseivirga sp. E12]MBO3700293.1 M56 family metallopeptidase [Roseivirga sp. E12]
MKGIEVILTWALIHSLWIGLGTLILTKFLTLVLSKSHSKRLVKIVAISVFFLFTISTMFVQSPSAPIPEGIWFMEAQPVYSSSPPDWADRCKLWIGENSLLISILWIVGASIGALRFFNNRRTLSRYKSTAIACNDKNVLSKIGEISRAKSIGRAVQVRVSALIDSPMTIGILKPIIYFPVGLINGFTDEELDAILRHELTHIKHHDYLINTLLVMIETLFFFNPFVLIMIRDLRREMEYVCDDAVIQVHSEFAYSRALMKLQETTLSNQVALAAKGNNSEFKNRIERMIYPNKTKFSPKAGIMVLLLATVLVSSAFVGKADPEPTSIEVLDQDTKQDTVRVKSWDEVKSYLKDKDSTSLRKTVIMLNGKHIPMVFDKNKSMEKSKKMMEEVQRELIKDGILNESKTKITLMFQYSDVLQGERTLGEHYEKYKGILNKYFPVYDSFATTRVFRYKQK